MKKLVIAAATASAALAMAAPAQAASLVSVSVQGTVLGGGSTTGTVWDTTRNGYYTAFVAKIPGSTLNPNDEAINSAFAAGDADYELRGEGWVPGLNVNSDIEYLLTLLLDNGASITGRYSFAPGSSGGQFIAGTSATVNGLVYSVDNFGWDRSGVNSVGAYSVGSRVGSDPNDYLGGFRIGVAGVPEPTTWALFILGFGLVGGAMRRRSGQVRVANASLNFA